MPISAGRRGFFICFCAHGFPSLAAWVFATVGSASTCLPQIPYVAFNGVRRFLARSRTRINSWPDRLRPQRKPSAAKHPPTEIIGAADVVKQPDEAKRRPCTWGRLRDASGNAATDGDGAASRSSLRTWLPPSASPAGLRRREAGRFQRQRPARPHGHKLNLHFLKTTP
ncbi:hypothetical protein SAMN05421740_10968 [Parapedobacter koreensis]|uniref:Secreted protein n=1 Tax=Parapedobacter koreensis TaxID=332977 RepID=A0A1H7SMH0_9SPHI|nr:hypothetical protein SAMN05421740_10968 [Parapedobacter koreensis]